MKRFMEGYLSGLAFLGQSGLFTYAAFWMDKPGAFLFAIICGLMAFVCFKHGGRE